MRALNLRYIENGWIDAEIDHPRLGWIPYTAAPNTGDEEAEAIWQTLSARDDVAPHVAPSETEQRAQWRQSASSPRTTFVRNCRRDGILSDDEAKAAAKGEWPQSFAEALGALPVEIDPVDAEIVWGGLSDVYRSDPVLIAIQLHRQMTDEQVDALFGMSPIAAE